ncbi:MAG: divalent-cation tolerance protein CutA [Clostridia bacterium]|nr:divalent-cation tolerance protein CutA [Clostridia bacterium]
MVRYIEVKTVFDSKEEAEKMAEFLLAEKLVACAQISKIESHYEWKGQSYKTDEFMLTMKTKSKLFKELEFKIREKHSYELAEIIATEIKFISRSYAEWIDVSTK